MDILWCHLWAIPLAHHHCTRMVYHLVSLHSVLEQAEILTFTPHTKLCVRYVQVDLRFNGGNGCINFDWFFHYRHLLAQHVSCILNTQIWPFAGARRRGRRRANITHTKRWRIPTLYTSIARIQILVCLHQGNCYCACLQLRSSIWYPSFLAHIISLLLFIVCIDNEKTNPAHDSIQIRPIWFWKTKVQKGGEYGCCSWWRVFIALQHNCLVISPLVQILLINQHLVQLPLKVRYSTPRLMCGCLCDRTTCDAFRQNHIVVDRYRFKWVGLQNVSPKCILPDRWWQPNLMIRWLLINDICTMLAYRDSHDTLLVNEKNTRDVNDVQGYNSDNGLTLYSTSKPSISISSANSSNLVTIWSNTSSDKRWYLSVVKSLQTQVSTRGTRCFVNASAYVMV